MLLFYMRCWSGSGRKRRQHVRSRNRQQQATQANQGTQATRGSEHKMEGRKQETYYVVKHNQGKMQHVKQSLNVQG